MRRFTLFCCAAMLFACAKSEKRPADDNAALDTAMAAEAVAMAPAISLADMAGTWKVTTTDEDGGNVVETQLVATAAIGSIKAALTTFQAYGNSGRNLRALRREAYGTLTAGISEPRRA